MLQKQACCLPNLFRGTRALAYLFDTPEQRQLMLDAIGVQSVDELFQQIPAELQLDRELDLPAPLSEMALQQQMEALLQPGDNPPICFLGGGVYDHFIPAVVDELTSRGEFYTAYTPYQAEASQGTLQAFYEYQTLICELTGMDVSNASLYEGGTAVSEAVFMAMRVTGRHAKVVVAGSVHPEYRCVLETYLSRLDTHIVTVETKNGVVDPDQIIREIDETTCAVVLQQPNFFGCLEDVEEITKAAHSKGALSILSFDAFSPGLLKKPADYDVDIAVAEGQPLGTPLQFGGPLLGIFTCRRDYVRKMPGRLIGRTTDRNGRDCFVLNLQAREQHIRRDKATSNICTNQGLIALRTTVFLSVIGKQGLIQAASLCHQKAVYAASVLTSIEGVELCFHRPFFREFAIRLPVRAEPVIQSMASSGFNIGPALNRFDLPGFDTAENCLLIALTEKRTRKQIDDLKNALQQALST